MRDAKHTSNATLKHPHNCIILLCLHTPSWTLNSKKSASSPTITRVSMFSILYLHFRPSHLVLTFLSSSHRLLKKIVNRVPCSEGYSHMGRFRNVRHKYRWQDYLVEVDRTSVNLNFSVRLCLCRGQVALFMFTGWFNVEATIIVR